MTTSLACGALSGFHALVSSGTTPKLIEKESQARLIGYGGMLMESFVAIMAIVVAGWGSILVMGILDPLGGIYTLFPLFGIANQLLAAIALTVVTAILCKQGLVRWAWVPGLPLAWDLVVTMTASYQKIFSDNPKIGYFAQHDAFVTARDQGEILAPATSAADMDKVVFNTMVQGTLSIVFAVLVLIVVAAAVVVVVRAVRAGGLPTSEEEDVPSRIFAPRSFFPTPAEKRVLEQWEEAGLDPSPAAARGHAEAH